MYIDFDFQTAKNMNTQPVAANYPLYTVAFPEFDASDADFVSYVRSEYDSVFSRVIDAHFPLLHGNAQIDTDTYMSHVQRVAAETAPVSFDLNQVEVNLDDDQVTSYAYLVADSAGDAQALTQLRDKLYTGPMSPYEYRKTPHKPGITVAMNEHWDATKQLSDALNADGLSLHGTISHLSVGFVRDGRFVVLAKVPLTGHTTTQA